MKAGLPNGTAGTKYPRQHTGSNLLKQETGKTAIELIHIYVVNEAKNRLKTDDQRVSDIAYELGFENLSYFSRLFKKETGISPNQFKKGLVN